MSFTINGETIVNNQAKPNIEVRLYSSIAPFETYPPAENTPYPSGGLVATTISGPTHGSKAGYRFTDISPGVYHVGFNVGNTITWQDAASAVTSGTLGLSGSLTLVAPDNTRDMIRFTRSTWASGDIGMTFYDGTGLARYAFVHSGPDIWSRNSLQFFNLQKTPNHPTFEIDDDHQSHFIVTDAVYDNVTSPLRFEHFLLSGSVAQPGIGSSIEWSAQNDVGGGTVGYCHIQTRMVGVTAGAEDGTMEFRTMDNGTSFRRFKIREDGWIECNSQTLDASGTVVGNAKFGIFQRATGNTDYGLVSLGVAGFDGRTDASGNVVSGNIKHFYNAGGTYFATNAPISGQASHISFQRDGRELMAVGPSGQTTFTYLSSGVAGFFYPLVVSHDCASSGAVGIGAGLQFKANARNGPQVEFASIQAQAGGVNPLNTNLYFAIASGGINRQVVKIDNDGQLNTLFSFSHAGPKLGFYGITPIVQPAPYTVTNYVATRTLDAATTTANDVARALSSLISDLKSLGILQGTVSA